ncbi:MAG: hypothetical protein R3F05_16670 [Planctomycetota bacterium]
MPRRTQRLTAVGGETRRHALPFRIGPRYVAAILTCVVCVALSFGGRGTVAAEEPADPFLMVRKVLTPRAGGPTFGEWVDSLTPEDCKGVEEAIRYGCAFLVKQQGPDGSFLGNADPMLRVGLTALAVLALMDAGHPYGGGSAESVGIRKGISFLRKAQDRLGRLGPDAAERNNHNHGFAMYALVRAFAITGDRGIQRAAQRALDFAAASRNRYLAWRYGVTPGDNDTDVTGVMMLAHAEARTLNRADDRPDGEELFVLDDEVYDGTRTWLDKMTDNNTGRVGYVVRGMGVSRYPQIQGVGDSKYPPEFSEAMTAVGGWLRLQMREDPTRDLNTQRAMALVAKVAPAEKVHRRTIDQYYWYWGARFASELDHWDKKTYTQLDAWRAAVVRALLGRQEPALGADLMRGGSWAPEGAWGSVGGRIYSSAFAVSTLRWAASRGGQRLVRGQGTREAP